MIKPLLHTWNMNLDYANSLVKDIGPEKWAYQPAPKTNHAAWVIGHLASSCDFTASLLGQKAMCPASYEALFGWNSSPSSDAKIYPAKEEVLKALDECHARLALELQKVPMEKWNDPFPLEAMRNSIPVKQTR